MKAKLNSLSTVVLLVGTFAFADIWIVDPTENLEYSKYTDVDVVVSGDPAEMGKSVALKMRETHVENHADAGTIHSTDTVTFPNDESSAVGTLENPTGGWPSMLGAQYEMHVDAKLLTLSGNRFTVNVYIEADPL